MERFELYMRGMEIANGYTELPIQQHRENGFLMTTKSEKGLVKPPLRLMKNFFRHWGNSPVPMPVFRIGVDRLIMALLNLDTIDAVLPGRLVPIPSQK